MSKLVVFGLALATVATLVFATVSGPARAADKPCSRKHFETELVKNACKEGGRKAALKAMGHFVHQVKAAKKAAGDDDFKLSCTHCHAKVGGDYPNTKNAVKDFRKFKAFVEAHSKKK